MELRTILGALSRPSPGKRLFLARRLRRQQRAV